MATGNIVSLEPGGSADGLRRSILFAFIGVSFLLVAALALSLAFHREEALNAGQRRAETLAFVLGDHLGRTIASIDTTLSQLAAFGTSTGAGQSGESWDRMLSAARSGTTGIASLSIVDANGVVTHSTLPGLTGQARGDTYLFGRLSTEPQAGLVADTPLRGRLSGQLVIPFGRRLPSADGKFTGMVVATLEPERLRGFYRSIATGRAAQIWVMHPEMAVLFREPSNLAQGIPDSGPLVTQLKSGAASGFLSAPLEPGGPVYLSAYERVPNPPLMIAVSLSQDDVLSAWRKDAIISGLVIAGFGLMLIVAWLLIGREIRRRSEAEARTLGRTKELAAAVQRLEDADAALRASQAQFQSIMDHAPMMVSLKDRSGRFIFMNKAYFAFAGDPPEAILGRTAREIRGEQHGAEMEAQDRAVIEGRRAMHWEIKLAKPNGERTVLVVKFPIYDSGGSVVSVGAILADVTEQKQAELHLAQAQRIEALGQLTGGIAHDFNNLLTSILLNADVLASVLDDKLRPLAEAVRTASERGADLTRRLLAFGRRQMLEPRATDIRSLFDGMEPLMRRTLGEHIDIQVQHPGDLWFAKVDPNQLETAVLNLALNARDAMPSGGQLTFETANVEIGAEEAAANPDVKAGQYVMVAVGDTGVGMAPDVLARAFEPFFTTKDVGKGTGLGLSMVHGFAKQSGGHARIDSGIGAGTTVRLFLPRSADAEAVTKAAASAGTGLPRGNEVILFVEDDAMVREHTGRQIVGLGYEVVTAESAADAIRHVENGCAPDLLFTDVVMPGGVNGRQLALKLRERWPHLRVLYTSGYAHGKLTIDGESVPSKYVLGKPYRRAELAAKLRDVLDEPDAK